MAACTHCLSPITDAGAPLGYCCVGCATVAALLKAGGLERYYSLRTQVVAPVSLGERARELAWLDEPLKAAEAHAGGGLARLSVDVQGIRCSACVWLIRELFKRQAGGVEALVQPAVGRVTLTFRAGQTDVAAFLRELERFGYLSGPARKSEHSGSDRVLTRLGICVALTMNAMVFAAAYYLGMTPADGPLFVTLRGIVFALSLGVLLVGGSEFFGRTLGALRMGMLSFDLPISLGILLGFSGSTLMMVRDSATFSYFDTLNVFTTLMLVGRWLQERVLEQNRRRLLADDGVDGLFARRLHQGQVETVAAARIRQGDEIVLPVGDLLVVDAELLHEGASFSLDWINGESVPRPFSPGQRVPAGAFHAGSSAVCLRTAVDFKDSSLLPLLTREGAASGETGRYGQLLQTVTRYYVPAVLFLAALGFALWLPHGLDAAISVTTSILVVTCPCALGLAIPLAYQLMAARLRQRGVFVCRDDFLDRAAQVRQVVFDKTGTLTAGTLRLTEPGVLHTLCQEDKRALYNLSCRSAHPKSRCITAALSKGALFDPAARVVEHAGRGMEWVTAGGTYRLGSAAFCGAASMEEEELVFALGGRVLAHLRTEETLRHDARSELAALRELGLCVRLLSGDARSRVDDVARKLGLPAEDAMSDLSPQGKAEWLQQHRGKEEALWVGDGINDRPGFDQALCAATPAIDRTTLAARADFYFLAPGIEPVRLTLLAARRLAHVTSRIRWAALSYNLLALSLCFTGTITPLWAALAMPASSILILIYAMSRSRIPRDAPAGPLPSATRQPALVTP